MHITKMTATFGKLQNDTLALQPGLNCIYAPNESGKSTWTRFLLNMCYGVPTRDRNPYADKNRYLPWAGGSMQGVMDVVHESRAYTLSRTTRRATAPMGAVSFTYGGTGDAVPGVAADDVGEFLLGVPREVYERSAFISQAGLAVQQDAELEKRIAALITTGEEDVSYSETYKRLREQRNRRKHNRTGLIPSLENQCAALEQELRALEECHSQLRQAEETLQNALHDAETLRDMDARWQVINAQRQADALRQQRQAAQKHLQQLWESAVKADAVCAVHPLHQADPDDLKRRLHPEAPKKPLPFWIGIAVATLGAAAFVLPPSTAVWAACGSVAAIGAAAAIYLFVRRRTYLAAVDAQQRDVQTLQAQISDYERVKNDALRQRESWTQYKTVCDSLPPVPQVDAATVEEPILSHAEVTARLRRAEEATVRSRTQLDMLTGRLTALGSDADKKELLQQNRRQIDLLQTEYDAITLAMSALDEANQVIQSRFSPALGARAAEIFGALTSQRYDKVTLSRSFELAAATKDDSVLRALPLLSQGAADQLYLAVRLAICEMVLPAGSNAPLVLDDALLSFDDGRMAAALDVLLDMAKTRQILLFTCQHREQTYLQGKQNVSLLTL